MSVDLFFAAPLIVRDLDSALRNSIRTKVHAYLESEKARQDIKPSPEESVATSFYRRESSILVDAGLDELEAEILSIATGYLEQTLKLSSRKLEIEQAWINVFEPGSQEGQHTHDGSLLSCSYYVDAPADCGCIVFPDPIGARRSYREFTQTTGSELLTRREIAVEPQPGRLVMFESWMPHYIQCNKSENVRISIAVNLREAKLTVTAPGPPAQEKASRREEAEEAPAARKEGHVDPGAAAATTGGGARPAPQPHLFNELFAVSPNVTLERKPIQDQIPVLVIDDLLLHPERVRDVVGASPAMNWKHEAGGRNFVDYYDCRLRFPIRHPNTLVSVAQQAIGRVYGEKTRPADASVDVNWFMQVNTKRAEFAVPHCDVTENTTRSFTCVLYLNDSAECSGGTAFFRFRPSGSLVMDDPYVRAVSEDPTIGEQGRDYWPEHPDRLWEQVGEVEMLPGRLTVFPSEYFHAAWHPENSFYEFPRLTLAYWMIV